MWTAHDNLNCSRNTTNGGRSAQKDHLRLPKLYCARRQTMAMLGLTPPAGKKTEKHKILNNNCSKKAPAQEETSHQETPSPTPPIVSLTPANCARIQKKNVHSQVVLAKFPPQMADQRHPHTTDRSTTNTTIERSDPLYAHNHEATQNGILIKLGLPKSGSDELMDDRTGRPVVFAQHTDQFVIENDKMNSYTEAESELSSGSRSFLYKVTDQVRKRQTQSSKDATKDSDKHSVFWECLCLQHCEHLYSRSRITSTICSPSKNTEDLTVKQMFDISEKWNIRTIR